MRGSFSLRMKNLIEMEIDLKELHSLEISPDEYVWLKSRFETGMDPRCTVRLDMTGLEAKGLIKMTDSGPVLREKALRLFGLPDTDFDSKWAELISTYPMKVGAGSNVRVLHAADPDARSNSKAKNMYRKMLGKRGELHQKVMQGLNRQLEMQRDKLVYLQNLETWLNQRTWEKWMDIREDIQSDGRNTNIL